MATKTPASANATAIYYCLQDEQGVLPSSPNFKQLAFTGGVPSVTRDMLQSSELDGSAEITSVRLGSYQVAHEQSVELSFGVHDDLMQSAMQSAWVNGVPLGSTSVTIDATAKTATVVGGIGDADVGDYIRFPELTGHNAMPVMVTAIDGDVITLGAAKVDNPSQNIDGLKDEAGVSTISINDKLMVGTTRQRLAILVEYGDMDGGASYDLVMDAEATGFSFNVAVNASITGTLSFIGRTMGSNVGMPSGATLTPAIDHAQYTGIDGAFVKDGAPLLLSTSADITLERNATPVFELGSKYMSHISYGKASNSVSVATFFYDYNMRSQFEAETKGDYSIACSLDNKAMIFHYPDAIITGIETDVSEGDIGQTVTLQPYKASGSPSSLIIRRIA